MYTVVKGKHYLRMNLYWIFYLKTDNKYLVVKTLINYILIS